MSGYDDAEAERRHKAPYTNHRTIPTIKKFRAEKEARQAEAREFEGHDTAEIPMQDADQSAGAESADQDHGEVQNNDDGDAGPAVDTTEGGTSATDPRARRKELKQRKDERAEREVTDPVTHLPVTIHDMTSEALKSIPENDEPFGTTAKTATGLSNKSKSGEQLQKETKELQDVRESMQALFPPPNFEAVKQELAAINKRGVTAGLVGIAAILAIAGGLERLIKVDRVANSVSSRREVQGPLSVALWLVYSAMTIGGITAVVFGVRDWMARRINSLWEDEVWEAKEQGGQDQKAKETETVAWLNALLGSVWPLINPDLFISLADTLEDVMQASLPKLIEMVSVNDIGQGSEAIRILGVKWLPTGAAARSVTEDGQLQSGGQREAGTDSQGGNKKSSGSEGGGKTQQGDDGAQQEAPEGLDAEEGDFINMEIAFAYRARSNKRSMKDRAKDMHLYMAFYLPGSMKIPVWVDLRGLIGTMRLRLQLCPDPPFFALCTLTFLGQPKVELSCTPLRKHAVNVMDVPLVSNFVQSSVDAAMAEYVAPKSLSLDLKDLLAGDDFKKDTNAQGVLVVHVKRGYDFKMGDTGIPLIKDGSSDPYVSVGWAKFGKPVWSTRLLLNEMEPWWEETAYLLVTHEELNVDERIRIQLWDSDRLTADDDLGRIEVDLKELMKNSQSNGQMWHREDGFRALTRDKEMPGKLEWSVGYFSKTRLQKDQLERQTFDKNITSVDQLKEKADTICARKLREANLKEGRHKQDADELEQQKHQEFKEMSDAMIISAPPPDGYPSGIFSIQIHQITGLELEKISKTDADKAKEGNDEEEEGEGLPSAYCNVIINHNKVFKTRTKPKNAKPFYNAGTERYIADWRNAEVYVSVRDARVSENDPILGIVHLPLDEIFKERSQVNGFYPLAGGIGYGRIRLSMVWRSVQLQAPPEALSWERGTIEIQSPISGDSVPENLRGYKLKFHTDLGSGKMYPENNGWATKNQGSLKLPVNKKYSSSLAVQFRHSGMFSDKVPGFAVLWLKDVPDEADREIEMTIWKGDYERATKNAIPEPGEKLGTIKVNMKWYNGLGAAHSKWSSKDQNVHDVTEVLETARDNYETMENEKEVGLVDANATDSSSDEDDNDETNNNTNGSAEMIKNPIQQLKEYKKKEDGLKRSNRGLMQWKLPRTAKWAMNKAERTESRISGMFHHHTRGSGVETEV